MATLTARQVAGVVTTHGGPPGGTTVSQWVALARGESSFSTTVPSPSGRHIGLWQIGVFHDDLLGPQLDAEGVPRSAFREWLKLPVNNWRATKAVYAAQGWGAWEASHAPTAESTRAAQSPDMSVANAHKPGVFKPSPAEIAAAGGVPIIGNPVEAALEIADKFLDVVNAIGSWISDPHNWTRVGFVVGGAALVIAAGAAVASETKAGQTVVAAGRKAATKGVL